MNVAHEYYRPHYIGPDECLDGRIFYLCNPAHFCRLRTCSVLWVPSKHLVYVRSKICPDLCKRKKYSIFWNWGQADDEIMIKYYKSFHLLVKWGRLKGNVYYTNTVSFFAFYNSGRNNWNSWKRRIKIISPTMPLLCICLDSAREEVGRALVVGTRRNKI